jgi:CRP-like cAMP-binding protein
MFDHKRSAATWKTDGDATVAFLDRDAWRALIESPEEVGSVFRVAVIRTLAARFRDATARVLELEMSRRDQLRDELADFLGVDTDEMADSQFSHYGIGGHRT